jgi:hypothetical protein
MVGCNSPMRTAETAAQIAQFLGVGRVLQSRPERLRRAVLPELVLRYLRSGQQVSMHSAMLARRASE